MDPKACLDLASDALDEKDLDECADALGNYAHWRTAGGFEPFEGADERATDLATALEEQRELRANSLYNDPDEEDPT